MSLIETLKKKARFRAERKVLDNADAKDTEYTERYINGYLVEQDAYIDGESVKDSLEAKGKYIDAASKAEREKREKAVAKADRRGKPLSKEEVMALRAAEEKKRFEAQKRIKNFIGRRRGR